MKKKLFLFMGAFLFFILSTTSTVADVTTSSQSMPEQQNSTTANSYTKDSNEIESFSFSEKYINIKANINDWLKQGALDQDQANNFLDRLDRAKTIDELNILHSDISKQVETNKANKTNISSTNEISSEQTTTKEEIPTSDSAKISKTVKSDTEKNSGINNLPKTGEYKNNLWFITGIIILIIMGSLYCLKLSSHKKEM